MCRAILRDTTWFAPRAVGRIYNVFCLLHNFIRGEVGADVYKRLYRQEDDQKGVENGDEITFMHAAVVV
ncbi:hypothetical protein LINPERPRIM_LOCUS28575 [Linum perenne]